MAHNTDSLRETAINIISGGRHGPEERDGLVKRVRLMLMGYFGPDGTQKLCGDRCMMHIESGPNKDRCTIHGKGIVVPNEASCKYYMKGKAAPADHMLMPIISPAESGLVYGKVQCRRCKHATHEVTRCGAAEKFLRVLGSNAGFHIDPEGCCDFQYPSHSGVQKSFRIANSGGSR